MLDPQEQGTKKELNNSGTDLNSSITGLGYPPWDMLPVSRIASNGTFSVVAGGGIWYASMDFSMLMRLDGDVGTDINGTSGWSAASINFIRDMAWVGDQWVMVGRYVTDPPPTKPWSMVLASPDMAGFTTALSVETVLGTQFTYFEPTSVSGNPSCTLIGGGTSLLGFSGGTLSNMTTKLAPATAVHWDGLQWIIGGSKL